MILNIKPCKTDPLETLSKLPASDLAQLAMASGNRVLMLHKYKSPDSPNGMKVNSTAFECFSYMLTTKREYTGNLAQIMYQQLIDIASKIYKITNNSRYPALINHLEKNLNVLV